jgi:Tol biopolymer transport system component
MLRKKALSTTIQAALLAGLALPAADALAAGDTVLMSVASDGAQGNDGSYVPSISADGRYMAFDSRSSNLVTGDTNGTWDVFVHDRQTRTTTRVSLASGGAEGNHDSEYPSIGADGRHVAFESDADNLVAGDTNGNWDVFVHDREARTTTRVSLASDGTQGNGGSYSPSISADGRYVAFRSRASNLVAGDTNGNWDVFVHDRQTRTTTRVSLASDGTQGNDVSRNPSISADGRYVAFQSDASNLVAGDINGESDVFVRDRQTRTTTRISLASGGAEGNGDSWNPSISADGRYVAFYSSASNLVAGDINGEGDIFVHDRRTRTTTRVSLASDGTPGNGLSFFPLISADGRYVAFESNADNLVTGDTNGDRDVFVHDREARTTTRVSLTSNGIQGNGASISSSISADGRHVAFQSRASDLVAGDGNGSWDVFVRDRALLKTTRADVAVSQAAPAGPVPKGSPFSYTVTVKNHGPNAANGVSLIDLIPQRGATLQSIRPSQGSCKKSKVAVCRLGKLAAGQSATVTVNLKATLAKGSVTNRVRVNAPPQDPKPANNGGNRTVKLAAP